MLKRADIEDLRRTFIPSENDQQGDPRGDLPLAQGPEDFDLSADADHGTEMMSGSPNIEAAASEAQNTATEKPKARRAPVSWWRDPATIPPRRSLYDGHYIRRAIGATVGGGGRAKTTRGVYEAICMSAGSDIATKEILPDGQLRVWVCNGEEDQDELDRRVAAACQRYGIVPGMSSGYGAALSAAGMSLGLGQNT